MLVILPRNLVAGRAETCFGTLKGTKIEADCINSIQRCPSCSPCQIRVELTLRAELDLIRSLTKLAITRVVFPSRRTV
jgi:hypothetical protein